VKFRRKAGSGLYSGDLVLALPAMWAAESLSGDVAGAPLTRFVDAGPDLTSESLIVKRGPPRAVRSSSLNFRNLSGRSNEGPLEPSSVRAEISGSLRTQASLGGKKKFFLRSADWSAAPSSGTARRRLSKNTRPQPYFFQAHQHRACCDAKHQRRQVLSMLFAKAARWKSHGYSGKGMQQRL